MTNPAVHQPAIHLGSLAAAPITAAVLVIIPILIAAYAAGLPTPHGANRAPSDSAHATSAPRYELPVSPAYMRINLYTAQATWQLSHRPDHWNTDHWQRQPDGYQLPRPAQSARLWHAQSGLAPDPQPRVPLPVATPKPVAEPRWHDHAVILSH